LLVPDLFSSRFSLCQFLRHCRCPVRRVRERSVLVRSPAIGQMEWFLGRGISNGGSHEDNPRLPWPILNYTNTW